MFNYTSILDFLVSEGVNAAEASKLATFVVAATANAGLAAADVKSQWVAEDLSGYRALVAQSNGQKVEIAFTAKPLVAGLVEYSVKVDGGSELQFTVSVLEAGKIQPAEDFLGAKKPPANPDPRPFPSPTPTATVTATLTSIPAPTELYPEDPAPTPTIPLPESVAAPVEDAPAEVEDVVVEDAPAEVADEAVAEVADEVEEKPKKKAPKKK